MTPPSSEMVEEQRPWRWLDVRSRFEARYEPEPNSGCWIWTGWRNSRGYGFLNVNGRGRQAFHVAYELFVGPVTSEVIDHRCRNRACVNPAHLRPLTHRENTLAGESFSAQKARQTTCIRGHELTTAGW